MALSSLKKSDSVGSTPHRKQNHPNKRKPFSKMQLLGSALGALVIAAGVTASQSNSRSRGKNTDSQPQFNASSGTRPLVHLTPNKGWMNDPNGLFYDSEASIWHAYYQYNPNDNVWGLPLYWGHATSEDLTVWEDHGAAIAPQNDESGAFSGSIIIDANNTSGFFNDSTKPAQRIVAFYTEHNATTESQYAAYSLDGGFTFEQYEHNPVLDIGSDQFRDPKVFWHEESERWVMTLALSQEYTIQIFTSENLKDWELQSNFSHHGILGYQYECPGLAKVRVERDIPLNVTSNGKTNLTTQDDGAEYKWVMFLSINPGSPAGGSVNEYFIGDFDGKTFTPQDSAARIVDHGKDFYALQTFTNAPNGDTIGIAWASNWDYCAFVPTEAWKSSMSIARNFTVRPYNPNPQSTELNLYSTPILNSTDLQTKRYLKKSSLEIGADEALKYNLGNDAQGLLEFTATWKVNGSGIPSVGDFADLSFWFTGKEDDDEYLRLGYAVNAAGFFVDRGNTDVDFVNDNPFFNNRQTQNIETYKIGTDGLPIYKVHGIIDRNIIELFFNDGSSTSTNLFFLSDGNYIGGVEITAGVEGVFTILDFEIKQLARN